MSIFILGYTLAPGYSILPFCGIGVVAALLAMNKLLSINT